MCCFFFFFLKTKFCALASIMIFGCCACTCDFFFIFYIIFIQLNVQKFSQQRKNMAKLICDKSKEWILKWMRWRHGSSFFFIGSRQNTHFTEKKIENFLNKKWRGKKSLPYFLSLFDAHRDIYFCLFVCFSIVMLNWDVLVSCFKSTELVLYIFSMIWVTLTWKNFISDLELMLNKMFHLKKYSAK